MLRGQQKAAAHLPCRKAWGRSPDSYAPSLVHRSHGPSFLQGRSVAVTGATNATMDVALPLKPQGAAAVLRCWIKAIPNLQHSSLDYEPEHGMGPWQTQQGGERPSLPRGFYLLQKTDNRKSSRPMQERAGGREVLKTGQQSWL